jgi:hypothetical protein
MIASIFFMRIPLVVPATRALVLRLEVYQTAATAPSLRGAEGDVAIGFLNPRRLHPALRLPGPIASLLRSSQ